MLSKNEEYIVDIIDMGMDLEGICKIENFTVFVPNALIGEKVKIKIIKVLKNFAYGKIIEIIDKSEYRREYKCSSFGKCGGCDGLHIDYQKLLSIKKNIVINALKKQNIEENVESKFEDIYGMGVPFNYRNKVQYPIKSENNINLGMGMYRKNSHDIIIQNNCFLQNKKLNKISQKIFDLINKYKYLGFDEKLNKGDFKHLILKEGYHTNEIMCVFVIASRKIIKDNNFMPFISEIEKIDKNIKSIWANINERKDNVILTDKNLHIAGREFIADYIGEYKYLIAPDSFFQVNTIQAEVLYNVLREKMKFNKEKRLLELYSGVGSIGIFLSKDVKDVVGVEIVESAVKMAKLNVKLNELNNLTYILDDASKAVLKLQNNNEYFDYVVVDPPRKGLDIEGINILKKLRPEKIGYVSCNYSTLARDIKLLSDMYYIQTINAVDMFPWTAHVECVCVLKLR